MKKFATLFVGFALALTWLWPLLVALSFQTTCTMGDDDSFALTLFLCTAITVVALPILMLTVGNRPPSRFRLSAPVVTIVPLLLTLNHALAVGFGTHSLCGPEYDSYVLECGARNYYYQIMWTYAIALSGAAMWPWIRRQKGEHSS